MEFNDLKAQYKHLKQEIDGNLESVISNTSFIMGSWVENFETNLAKYLGVKHAITCSDGTAALQLIYMAYGIGQGDAVFCPDMTFVASVEPASMLGATPIFCEIDEYKYNIDPASLERQINAVIEEGKLTPKAVVAVDFLGNPVDYDTIRTITEKYNLLLIEDAAQGISASYKGKKCGSLGDIAATSFFPSKPLGCYGDGGAVFTNDDEIAELLRSYRIHGQGSGKYDNIRIGINSRLDAIQAAILLPKLKELPVEIEKRQVIAKRYSDALKEYVIVPTIQEGAVSAYAQYVIRTKSSEERERIQEVLKNKGILTILYYPTPMHSLPVFKGLNSYGETFKLTNQYSECSFGIPFSAYLTEENQDVIIDTIISALR